jgi:hypothetical protein
MTEQYTLTYDAEVSGDRLNITIDCNHPAFPIQHVMSLQSAASIISSNSDLESIINGAAYKKIQQYEKQQKISNIDLSGTIELTINPDMPPERTPPPVEE